MSGHDAAHAWFNNQEAEANRLRKLRMVGDDVTDLYGKATLLNQVGHDLSPLASPKGSAAVPLGRDPQGASTGLAWVLGTLQGHQCVFGATRSGKGVTSIIPTLLSYSGSMVVIDPKAENAWATMERRRAMGQRVLVLDPWGELQRRYGNKASPRVQVETARFNPLAGIDPTSEDFADDVTAIAEALVIPGLGEAHWTDSARELIGGLVALCCMRNPGKANLGDVRKLVASAPQDLVDTINEAIETDPDSLAARKLARFTVLTNETNSVRAVADTQTAILDSRRLVDAMQSDENPFDLAELGTGKATLYLVLPLDRLQTHGRWMRLIITMAIRAIAKLEDLPAEPVYFCLDEAGTIGQLKMVEQAFGLMAGVGIRVAMYLQDIGQLQRDYPSSWETFISNSSVIQCLKVSDVNTSTYISNLMGTTTRMRFSADTMQMRSGKKMPWGTTSKESRGDPTVSTAGDQVMSRALMLPQEVRSIPGHQVLNIIPGVGNYLMDRMPYYAPDSIWQGQYRSPPWFAKANAAAHVATSQPAATDPTPKKRSLFGR